MENKHTKGKWHVLNNMVKAKWPEGISYNSCIICELKYEADLRANAKLIASAPQLLEAAQKMLYALDNWEIADQTGFNRHLDIDAHISLQEAIKKATE